MSQTIQSKARPTKDLTILTFLQQQTTHTHEETSIIKAKMSTSTSTSTTSVTTTDLSSSSQHSNSSSSVGYYGQQRRRQQRRRRKVVTFDTLEILYFPIGLGDHPCATDGPAITIASTVTSTLLLSTPPLHVDVYDIDEYEKFRRSGVYKRRQNRNDFRLSGDDRIQLLLDNHCATMEEIDVAMSEGEKIRKSRMKNSSGYYTTLFWGTKSLDFLAAIAKGTVHRTFKKRSTSLIVGSSSNNKRKASSPIRGCCVTATTNQKASVAVAVAPITH